MATRKASQLAINALAPVLPEFVGGSADLTGSNLTNHKQSVAVDTEGNGNHVSYGVREFGMCAIANGMALHGGVIPYVGTFLVFSDYARNAVRMAALMKQRVLYIFTHDSIGVGEDGPTHQPVEHVASLRLIPGLNVWRPADSLESAVAYAVAKVVKNGRIDLADFRGEALADPATRALAARIHTLSDGNSDPNALAPQSLTVHLKDGRVRFIDGIRDAVRAEA